ncbi:MAG: hypothetical protein JW825_06300 [Candidatus Methanofastidiosa archaeon]|nr:hypothetical protein [Candidatus Methanofastidiosa archaeon]
MKDILNLGAVEKSAVKSQYEDGILDIFLGTLLIIFGIFIVLDMNDETYSTMVFILLEALAILSLVFAKRMITVPRIGKVKLSLRRSSRSLKVTLVLAISVLSGLVLMTLVSIGINSIGLIAIFWATNCILVFFLMAYFLDHDGFYVVGIMYAISLSSLEIVNGYIGTYSYDYLHMFIPGMVVVIYGMVQLRAFLKKYDKY